MAKTAKKSIIKAGALDKIINSSTEALDKACNAASKAVAKKAAEAKKLTAEVKRHSKKKATLSKRKKTASTRQKKNPNAENRKAVTAVIKEIKSTGSALDKARASKAVTSTELSALKSAEKRLSAYTKAIAAADKVLNKPKKRRKKAAR